MMKKYSPANDGSLHVQPSLVLLDCNLEETDLVNYPILQDYLDWGKSQGFADRYITRHRQPWFKQENRPPAPILCSYMSRGKSGEVWATILPKLFGGNCYKCLPDVISDAGSTKCL